MEQPLSPHLQIYKLPFTAILSIAHRLSGLFLYLGFVLFAWIFIVFKFYPTCVLKCLSMVLSYKIIIFALFMWSLMFFYHMLNGLRHLLWDIGYGFEIKKANFTGIIVLFLAIMINFFSWFYIF